MWIINMIANPCQCLVSDPKKYYPVEGALLQWRDPFPVWLGQISMWVKIRLLDVVMY